MWLARRFSLLFLLVASAATTGYAVTPGCGITPIAAFTPLPEIKPIWTAVGSCILAAALILRHRAKVRK